MNIPVKFFIICCVLLYGMCCYAQGPVSAGPQPLGSKAAFDLSAIDIWPSLTLQVSLSDDGRYVSYRRSSLNTHQMTVQSIDGNWRYQWSNYKEGVFSGDSRWYVYQQRDSLYFLSLGSNVAPRFVGLITGYQVSSYRNKGKVNWLAYQLKGDSKTVVLHRFSDGREERIEGVNGYEFDVSGRWLLCRLTNGGVLLQPLTGNQSQRLKEVAKYTIDKGGNRLFAVLNSEAGQILQGVDLLSGKTQVVHSGSGPSYSIGAITTDGAGNQMAFIVQEKKDREVINSIWYWSVGMAQAVERVNNQSVGIGPGLFIGEALGFAGDDAFLWFMLQPAAYIRKPRAGAVQVDIWHYADTMIQSAQLMYGQGFNRNNLWMDPRRYLSTVNVKGGSVVRVGGEHLRAMLCGNYGLQRRDDSRTDAGEVPPKDSMWVLSIAEGVRHFLAMQYLNEPVDHSLGGRYLLWFDRDAGHYFTYELSSGRQVNISAKVPVYLGSEVGDDPVRGNARTGILGWLAGDAGLLVYDSYDIWQLDPAGRKASVNLTNGYGRRHGIRLRLTRGGGNKDYESEAIAPDAELLLTAVDTATYANGFFRKSLNRSGDPEKLFMGPYVLDWTPVGLSHNNGNLPEGSMAPLKARDANMWIVRRQSASEAPNYYATRDLKTYKALTDVQPHKAYNWLTKELVSFQQVDGSMSRGLLYRPEDFDASKKYPVIILHYFQFSQLLHEYPALEYTNNAQVNIPWLVSRGYLVFTPDTWFRSDRPRPASAWNTVEGAARYLKGLPYVDSNRIGVTGHSRGGGFTNYIITHSTQFAAAFEGAGVSDWMSAQTTLGASGIARSAGWQEFYTYTNKQFIGDNPILNVDRITSPLLIFHNQEDRAVPWAQAVELYIAMRRLGKKVWMLQYDKEEHNLRDKNNKRDLTMRMTQFFDHYLKGTLPPRWMTTGVPAKRKGIETGLEPDSSGRMP